MVYSVDEQKRELLCCLLLTEAKLIGSAHKECVGSGNWLIVDRLTVLKADMERGFLQS